jgi:hypothetical protein
MDDYTYEEFVIQKKGKNKVRKIVSPSPELKTWQRKINIRLNAEFKVLTEGTQLENIFHGFVSQRNAVTAAEHHIPFSKTIMMDITNFFDSINRSHFDGLLELDKIENSERLFHKDGYTAQGFPSSPMLCNIALIPAMTRIVSNLDKKFGEGKYALTIYADDIQLSLTDTATYDDEAWAITMITEELVKLNLEINKNKTRIKREKFGARRILGLNVTNKGLQATRKTMRKLRAVNHQRQYNKEKHAVYRGLKTWSTCQFPKHYGKMFSL